LVEVGSIDAYNSTTTNQFNYWHDHVAAFVSSGKTQKDYCKLNNINHPAFKKWRYKLSAEFPVNKFYQRAITNKAENEINVAPAKSSTVNSLFAAVKVVDKDCKQIDNPTVIARLRLKDHISLDLLGGIDASDINKIFTALEIL